MLKNWEFRVFAKQAFSKNLGLLRFGQTGLFQKIGAYTKFFLLSKLIHKQITKKDKKYLGMSFQASVIEQANSNLSFSSFSTSWLLTSGSEASSKWAIFFKSV